MAAMVEIVRTGYLPRRVSAPVMSPSTPSKTVMVVVVVDRVGQRGEGRREGGRRLGKSNVGEQEEKEREGRGEKRRRMWGGLDTDLHLRYLLLQPLLAWAC